jgi:hypothetical protein
VKIFYEKKLAELDGQIDDTNADTNYDKIICKCAKE